MTSPFLADVRNYDSSHPKLVKDIKTWQWSGLFLIDLLLGLSASTKNKANQVVKKLKIESGVGGQFRALNNANIVRMTAKNHASCYSQALKLPSIEKDYFTRDFFLRWKALVNMPLVIKNYLSGAPILEQLSLQQLIKDHGCKQVVCGLADDDPQTKEASTVGQNIKSLTTSLEEYLTDEKFKNYYVNNFFGLFSNQDFLDQCNGTELESLLGKKNILTQWFVSRRRDSGSSLHCASADNMFLNLKGRKEWFFVDPSYTPIMQASMSKHGVFCVSEMDENFEGDFYAELIKQYPYMCHVPIYKVVLEEGDLLFNPPWWWHRVKNLNDHTIGCATRYFETDKSWSNSRTFSLGMLIESLKNPIKSPLYLTFKCFWNKDNAKDYIHSIFSSNIEEKRKASIP